MADQLIQNLCIPYKSENYVCVEELRRVFFMNTKKETFKTRIKRCKINKTNADNELRKIIISRIGNLQGGYYVMKAKSAVDFVQKFLPKSNETQTNQEDTAAEQAAEEIETGLQNEHAEEMETEEIVPQIAEQAAEEIETGIPKDESSVRIGKGFNCKRCWTIKEEDMSLELKMQIKDFHRYWTTEYQRSRPSKQLSTTTAFKIVERLKQYFFFIQRKNIQPNNLQQCTDLELIEEFMTYCLEERKISTGTLFLFLQAIQYACKYVYCNSKRNDYSDIECIVQVRNLQRQAQLSYSRQKRLEIPKRARQFYWSEVLTILKQLKERVENYNGSLQDESRLFMNFLILLLFTSCNPARNLDYIHLRIADDRNNSYDESRMEKEDNYIHLQNNGSVYLIFKKYKTATTYGCQVIDISSLEVLLRYVTEYLDKHRHRLLSGKEHDFLFIQKDGCPFSSSAAFSKYLGKTFESYSDGLRLTTTNMRKACVNFVLNEGEPNKEIADSLARLMRHTPRMQRLTYHTMAEDATHTAVRHLSDTAASFIGASSVNGDDEPPHLEQIVALVTDQSTYNKPDFFLGKVIHLNRALKTASLAHLVNVERNSFTLSVGKSNWEENWNSLVHPIDIVYNEGTGMYTLRTKHIELHEQVYGKKK